MSDTPFHEFRVYSIEAGRTDDMLARVRGPLAELFARHGIEVSASWIGTAGPGVPAFLYLMRWRSWAQREAAWAGFYGDPQWHRARAETNAGSELVERYDLNFLRESVPLGAPPAGLRCEELVVARCRIGASAAGHRAVREQLGERLAAHGAALFGAFEFITGTDLPRFAVFVAWPDLETRERALDALAIDPLGRAERWLLGHASRTAPAPKTHDEPPPTTRRPARPASTCAATR